MKRAITVLTAVMISILMGGSWAWATPTDPNADHKVTICHRTGSADGGELKNGYNEITVDIASSGYVKGGHTGHEQVGNGPGPDIIPAYEAFAKVQGEWEPFSFPGSGLDWVFEDGTTGAEFLANGCALNTPPEPEVIKTQAFVDFFDPTCKDKDAYILSEYDTQLVKAELEGTVAPGEKVVVTFTAKQENVEFTTATVWKHTFADVPKNCGEKPDKPDKPDKPENPDKPDKPKQDKPDKPEAPVKKVPELPATGANLQMLGAALALIIGGAGLYGASRLTRSV